MYIPHGDYPKDQKPFNVIEMLPELFEKIDLRDFSVSLESRAGDFFASELFLYSSQFQNNYGAKLIMLLSAVERSNGTWKPLEAVLSGKDFRKALKASRDGINADNLLQAAIEKYLDDFGSTRSVVKFYKDNLSVEQKQRIVAGIGYGHTYRKKKIKTGTLYSPEYVPSKKFDKKEEEVNYELAIRLRHVIYNIRSGFVHKASYIPFPDKKFIKDRKLFYYERYEAGEPKDSWVITLPFEVLHELTRLAFIEFWCKEYYQIKKRQKE